VLLQISPKRFVSVGIRNENRDRRCCFTMLVHRSVPFNLNELKKLFASSSVIMLARISQARVWISWSGLQVREIASNSNKNSWSVEELLSYLEYPAIGNFTNSVECLDKWAMISILPSVQASRFAT